MREEENKEELLDSSLQKKNAEKSSNSISYNGWDWASSIFHKIVPGSEEEKFLREGMKDAQTKDQQK